MKMPKKNIPTDVFININMHDGDIEVCWEWKGKPNAKDGRPYITIEGARRPAYVIVLELYTGEHADGRYAIHSCDNCICCNPHHLNWGTHQDNMDDMKERDRHGLPRTVVRAIHKLLDSGKDTHQTIADLYGVSRETITGINNGRGKSTEET
jgi:hypothetical protein